ncbi:MAG TPA: hypothetical protein VGC29_06120, partial [Flavisolibacter sp.]
MRNLKSLSGARAITKNLSSMVVLMLMLFAPFSLYAQYAYSAKDLAAIQQKRKEGARAEKNWDRKTLFHLGNFYREIYNRYQDTSMNASIRSYKQSCFTEGDFMEDEPLMAAFELGNIYEKGIGIEPDAGLAMIYFFISDSIGENRLSALSDRVCPADTIVHTSPSTDSLAIAVNPFCGLKNAATIHEIKKLAAMAGYDRKVNITLYMPGDFY